MILAFTGAGISKDSGISTFMEKPEVRARLFRSFANQHPQAYNETITQLVNSMRDKKPNDAHHALFEYNIPIITMNIDGLHELAGSNPLTLHGTLPTDEELVYASQLTNKPVLYEDPAPNYAKAYEMVNELQSGDVFLVIGASFHTAIAHDLRVLAKSRGAEVVEIQDDAKTKVREYLRERTL
ncbi:transcriptional regulator [Erysipelothrix larvae]|uniref:protein acetyllysine N-acetyltransferase n=1 Tax=Erysipelothrix larvae TaxID=1514105 RepID=A0A0X8H1W6_9FIRM|nr:Sir2 family NAD-dependent protein deacetylase [Erysipelothrix larvae]AMC94541.1 transcriptional regulator [Erysipelothrix larvae]